jgi:single-strand DNA-binding protein
MANFNLNKTVLGGRLTADVELKQTPNGVPVASFTIAVTRKADREKADFINCVAWRNTAEFISKYFSKGSSICVTGAIQTRSWEDSNGQKRYATEVIVDDAYFVDSKSESAVAAPAGNVSYAPAADFEELSADDQLPF